MNSGHGGRTQLPEKAKCGCTASRKPLGASAAPSSVVEGARTKLEPGARARADALRRATACAASFRASGS
jgi:hypothetical protein